MLTRYVYISNLCLHYIEICKIRCKIHVKEDNSWMFTWKRKAEKNFFALKSIAVKL